MRKLMVFVLFGLLACTTEKQPITDFALPAQQGMWLRHPVLGDPSFDGFTRYGKNPVMRGAPPFNWPVNGFYFEDPVSGNEYIYVGQYHAGYALSEDKNDLEVGKNCVVYSSADSGKTWNYRGPVFKNEAVVLDGENGPLRVAPDVSVVYADGKYYMGFDYATTEYTWDRKDILHGGLAVAVSDKPEGPFSIFSKPAISNRFFCDHHLLGKYDRCYGGTLMHAGKQWVFLFDLDSGPYFSWGLAAISAPAPGGPWSQPALITGCETGNYHPSLLEYYPAFQHQDTLYVPATSVARNRNFQCIFRVAANDAMDPKKWELWKEGSLWHSNQDENEYAGIWGQTFTGFVTGKGILKVMYPSLDPENRGTINLASVNWNKLYRDTGFVFSGHGAPSFTSIPGFYSQPDIEALFSYYGTVAFVWDYRAPVGPDRPQSDAELHPLMFTAHTRFQLSDDQWVLLRVSSLNRTDTISQGTLEKKQLLSFRVLQRHGKTSISVDNKVLWQGWLDRNQYGHCGLFAMKHSGLDMRSYIVSGKNSPGYTNWLYTEGLNNSGSNLKDWEIAENNSLFTYGIGGISKIDTACAKWSFTGTGFDLYCPKMPSLGIAQIILNGKIVGEINLHSGTPEKSAVVYSMRALPGNKNALTIRGKNSRISLDCLRVFE
jgi:hypothetical protein